MIGVLGIVQDGLHFSSLILCTAVHLFLVVLLSNLKHLNNSRLKNLHPIPLKLISLI